MTSLFSKVTEQYGELVNFIIRPPRDTYSDEDLGPAFFSLAGKAYKRTDLELINRRNMRLQCSHYKPLLVSGETKQLPCVIYLHGNCSSRVEALSALPVLLPHNITVFAFDFSGSGRSDGPYISLGWWERDDLDTVVEHLRSTGTVSSIGLWGRSMGAVTALMHAHRDPSIGGMVLDSPFASLRRLAEELADVVMQFTIPKFVLSMLLGMVSSSSSSSSSSSKSSSRRRHQDDLVGAGSSSSSSSNSSELCSNASSSELVIPLHPFADPDFSPAAAAAPKDTEAAAAAAAVAGRQAAAGRCVGQPPLPQHQQQQQQQQQDAVAAPVKNDAVSGEQPSSAACSPTTTSSSSRRRPWRTSSSTTSSSSSSSSTKREAEQQHAREKSEGLFHRRSSLLSRGLLRWGTSRSQCDSVADAATAAPDAAAADSNSSRSRQQQIRDSQPPTGEARVEHAAATTRPPPAAAGSAPAAAGAAATAAATDPVRGMAPPMPSFCFFNRNAGLEPLGFIEDEDEVLQRAISISLEEFIREQQIAAEAAAKEQDTPCPSDA
ncbi:hypothetical protein ACSSS7_003318 [Eimeria intestinalis]